MKILFVYDEIRLDIPGFTGYYQEGLASLSACARAAGHSTELLHLTRPLTEEEFTEELGRRRFDVIGFSSLTPTFPDVRRLVPIARNRFPSTPILYGGVHPTLDPESSIQVTGVDGVCVGEGEEALVEVLDRMQSDRDWSDVRNFWVRRGDQIIRNPTRPLVTDLDSLPLPDIELFDFPGLFSTREQMAMLTASRGCPYKCTYCSNHAQQQQYPNKGDYVRFKSVDRTIAEAHQRIHARPDVEIRYLDFSDDILPLRRSWFSEFAERFPKEVGAPFQCNVLLSLLNDQSVRELKQAGCGLLVFGLESGSERMRDLMKRPPVTNRQIVHLAGLLHQHDLHIGTYNMVGLPTETTEEMLETIKLNATIHPNKMNVFFFQPYPNTDIHKMSVEMGLYHPSRDLFNNWRTGPVLEENAISHEQIIFLHRFFKLLVRAYRMGRRASRRFDPAFDHFLESVFFRHPQRMALCTRAWDRIHATAKFLYVKAVLPFWSRRKRELSDHLNGSASEAPGWRRFARRAHRFATLVGRHGPQFLRYATPRKVANLALAQWQMLTRTTRVRGYPFEMIVDPNNYCNLRCPLCPTGQHLNERSYGEMPFAKYERLLDEVAPYLFKVRFYNWGEPLLHKSIHDMIAAAHRRRVSTEVSSNLSHGWTEEDADRLIESGLDRLIVSLDGATPDTYRVYRVGGDFDKVTRNVRMIADRKKALGRKLPEIELQFIVMRHNEHQVNDVPELARRLGADHHRLVPVVLNNADAKQRAQYLPAEGRFSRYDYDGGFTDKIFASQPVCPWPWRSAVVNWDGSVSSCCIFEGHKTEMGNAFEAGGFKQVWTNGSYSAARAALTGRPPQSTGDAAADGGGQRHQGHELCAKCMGMPQALTEAQRGLY